MHGLRSLFAYKRSTAFWMSYKSVYIYPVFLINSMSSSLRRLKKSVTLFFNAYGLKEIQMLLKYHKFSLRRSEKMPMLISMVDGRRLGKGLTDRFKGIVSVYALAKANDVLFRCIYNHPIQLVDFLVPNDYNWLPQPEELSDTVSGVRFKLLRKQHTIKRLLKVLPPKKQIRVYANLDYVDEINSKDNQQYQWGQLFGELFRPTKLLEDQLQLHRNRMGNSGYIACVFRFQNLLGDFKEYHFKPLPEAGQRQLIAKNINALKQISEQSDMPVLVTSDSATFIAALKTLKNIYTIPGRLVHIDNVVGEENEVYLKSFVDFFMLSRAEKIYSLGTAIMYKTDFPKYAAKVHGIPFERILIE